MTTLVFSGGSTKAVLHVGALKAINELGSGYETLFGNSAGSIIAALIAVGKPYDEIENIVFHTDFRSLIKNSFVEKVYNVFLGSGLVRGARIEFFFREIIGKKKFSDLEKYDLNIIAHCLRGSGNYVVFNKKNTPDLEIWRAVRASTSIPVLFSPYKIGDDFYVDGGVSKDFPVDLVRQNDSYIAHLINDDSIDVDWSKARLSQTMAVFIKQLIEANVKSSIRECHKRGLIVRSSYRKSFLDFSLSHDEKMTMLKIGYINTKNAFNKKGK